MRCPVYVAIFHEIVHLGIQEVSIDRGNLVYAVFGFKGFSAFDKTRTMTGGITIAFTSHTVKCVIKLELKIIYTNIQE